MTRPTRYKENESNRDWIDEFCATKSVDEVRGAFMFNLGKYQRRYGKKDEHLQEALKIQDYANRLVEYERSIVKPIIRELYTDADQEKAKAMIAAAWEEGEKRMEQIGPNGNDGLAYEKEWTANSGDRPDLPEGTVVEVRIKDGRAFAGVVDSWLWGLEREFDEITHYRLA